MGFAVAQREGLAGALAALVRRRIHHFLQGGSGLGLIFLRKVIEHVDDLMVPAALFGPFGMLFPERSPDSEATSTLSPLLRAPTMTSSALVRSSKPHLTYNPSAQA